MSSLDTAEAEAMTLGETARFRDGDTDAEHEDAAGHSQTLAEPPPAGLGVGDVERLTGMPADRFICGFESLGDNCEFGLVQRACGAEPLGLLRFSNIHLPNLLRLLRARFEGFGAIENLSYSLTPGELGEYNMRERKFWMGWHTWQVKGQVDEASLLQQQAVRLKFLARKLIEDLEDGRKIFVRKDPHSQVIERDMMELSDALAVYGRNTLLWVTVEDDANPAGTVRQIRPGLLHGRIDRFAPYVNVHDFSLAMWLALCVRAREIVGAPDVSPPVHRTARPVLAAAMALQVKAHIQGRGDMQSREDGLIGSPGERRGIEGFAILEDPHLPAGLSYQAVLSDGSLTEPGVPGQYRGTRKINQQLLGFIVHLDEQLSGVADAVCEAWFVGGARLGPVGAGVLCVTENRARLEAIRIVVRPRD
jgi:hypothetical protein